MEDKFVRQSHYRNIISGSATNPLGGFNQATISNFSVPPYEYGQL